MVECFWIRWNKKHILLDSDSVQCIGMYCSAHHTCRKSLEQDALHVKTAVEMRIIFATIVCVMCFCVNCRTH